MKSWSLGIELVDLMEIFEGFTARFILEKILNGGEYIVGFQLGRLFLTFFFV